MKKMEIIKNKLNFLMIILIFIGLLAFSGCSLSSNSTGNENGLSIGLGSSNSNSGKSSTAGIVLKFDENNPPSEMIKGQPVTFALIFENYLTSDVNNLEIKTKGFDRGFISGLPETITVNNIPRMTSVGVGKYQQVISGVVGDNFNGNYNFNPVFEYAYDTKTEFIEQICIPSKKNKCDVKVDKSKVENGPVTININRVTSLGDNIRIDFSAQNSGNGKVVNSETKFKTDDYAVNYDLEEVKLGSIDGDCHHIGVDNYQFMNGKSNFYCTFSRSSDDSYASQITVKLDYTYNQEVSKKIIIKDLNQNY